MLWQKLVEEKKPFFTLAPMADVTDPVFRQVILKCGRPDVFWTEFVSADGVCSEKGRKKLIKHLKFTKREKPIIAQFFSNKPENIYKAVKLAIKLGFDGVDINMGCPDKKIIKSGGGAALIKNFELAKEIIKTAKEAAGASNRQVPISVKTRIGYDKIITETWIANLVEARPDAIIVHGRTVKEMSKVSCHWDEIAKAAKIIKRAGIVVIGNGDVLSLNDGIEKAKKYNVDGIMIGRAIFQNPWLFSNKAKKQSYKGALCTKGTFVESVDNAKKRIALAKYHLKLFEKFWGRERNYDNMKKFYKMYISGWPACAGRDGSKSLRSKLMATKNPAEALAILTNYKAVIL